MAFSLVPALLLGYLLGSVPFAYLLVHWKERIDLRLAGSGNVGALNSFQVTGSHWVGVAVLLLDLMKGVCAVILARAIWGDEFPPVAAMGVGAVTGHNFPVWLKFRGGRGLATAAGIMLVVAWVLVPVWVGLWALVFLATREVNVANAGACVLGLTGTSLLPDNVVQMVVAAGIPQTDFRLFAGVLFALLLTRLAGPLRSYVGGKIRQ